MFYHSVVLWDIRERCVALNIERRINEDDHKFGAGESRLGMKAGLIFKDVQARQSTNGSANQSLFLMPAKGSVPVLTV